MRLFNMLRRRRDDAEDRECSRKDAEQVMREQQEARRRIRAIEAELRSRRAR